MKKDVFCLLGKALRRSDAATLRHNGVLTFVSIVVFAVSAAIVTFAPNAWGDTILHNFAGTPDGAYAYGTLVNDKYGNLYGTTVNGGTHGYGTVFVLCAPGAAAPDLHPCTTGLGVWTEFVLYNFKGPSFGDGAFPNGTLVFNGLYAGRKFTLYGTTSNGGSAKVCRVANGVSGCGTVFEVCAPSNFGGCGGVNQWKEHVLHTFLGGNDGEYPFGGVITDKASDLFGTTVWGGHQGTCVSGNVNIYCGTVFKLKGQSPWNFPETILHRFNGSPNDGANPYASLCCSTIYTIPYLYGTTANGGASNWGTVFKVKNSGAFPETVLHGFTGTPDGANPFANVIFDSSGNLYGTTYAGGVNSEGLVFELVAPLLTTETPLYSFCPLAGCADGANPEAGLLFDTAGNLYGTTFSGGTGCGGSCGTVFMLPPSLVESVLYSFVGGTGDGANPFAGVIYDTPVAPGVLYGVTTASGSSSSGVAFSQP